MDWLETLIVVAHVVVAIAVVALVLIQQGKGADVGAAFGGGASQTVFGSQGSGSFLTKLTTILAILFFVTSFTLAVFAKQRAESVGITGVPAAQESSKQEPAQQSQQQDQAPALEESSQPTTESAPAQDKTGEDVPAIE
ncbi:preprotein translocase subunit SecG [Marinobacteraceae bacterium S3BR75-40.1]